MAHLIVEKGANKGSSQELPTDGRLVVGRSRDVDFQIKERFVSRTHFAVEGELGTYILQDLDSDNGTFVNGESVEQKVLEDGDHIQIGETHLSFVSDESRQAREDLIGEEIAGYEILDRIGRGGMGTVYRARQLSLDRVVALKILESELVEDEKFVEQFLSEARSAAKLNHPNVTKVYDVGNEGDVYYLSMEYIKGGSLHDLLSERDVLDPDRAVDIIRDIAKALEFAKRKNLVHRDIKPGNIMLTEDGKAKLIDLGIAKQGMKEWEEEGVMVGTPDYMAPEQATEQSVDTRADIYALGVTFYRMVTGERPIKGETAEDVIDNKFKQNPIPPSDKNDQVPKWISSLIMDMIKTDPANRVSTPSKVLDRIKRGRDELHSVFTMKGMRKRRLSSSRWPLFLSAAVILGLIGIAYFFRVVQTTGDQSSSDGQNQVAREKTKNGPVFDNSTDREKDTEKPEEEKENEKDKKKKPNPARKLLARLNDDLQSTKESPSREAFQTAIQRHETFLKKFSDHEKREQVEQQLKQVQKRKQKFLLNQELADLRKEFQSLKTAFGKKTPVTVDQIKQTKKFLLSGSDEVMGLQKLRSNLSEVLEEYHSVDSEEADDLKQQFADWKSRTMKQLDRYRSKIDEFSGLVGEKKFREVDEFLTSLQKQDLFQVDPFQSSLNVLKERADRKERKYYRGKTDEIVQALTRNEFDRARETLVSARESLASEELRRKLAEEKKEISKQKERHLEAQRRKRKKEERKPIFRKGAERFVRMEDRFISPENAPFSGNKELEFQENVIYRQFFQFLTRRYRDFYQLLGNRAASFNYNIIDDPEYGQVEISEASPKWVELELPGVSATAKRSWNDFSVVTLLSFVFENRGDLSPEGVTALASMYYLFDHVEGVARDNLKTLLDSGNPRSEVPEEKISSLLLRKDVKFQRYLIKTMVREARRFLAKGKGQEAWNYCQLLRKRYRDHSYFKANEAEIKNLIQRVEKTLNDPSGYEKQILLWPLFIRPHVEYVRKKHLPRIERVLMKMDFRMEYHRRGRILLFLGRYDEAFTALAESLQRNWLEQLKQGKPASNDQKTAGFYETFYKAAVMTGKPEDVRMAIRQRAIQLLREKDDAGQERVQNLKDWKEKLENRQQSLKEHRFSFGKDSGTAERLNQMRKLLGDKKIPNLKKKFVILRSMMNEFPDKAPVKSGDVHYEAARLLMKLGDYLGAFKRFKKFQETYPEQDRAGKLTEEDGMLNICKKRISHYNLR